MNASTNMPKYRPMHETDRDDRVRRLASDLMRRGCSEVFALMCAEREVPAPVEVAR